MRRIGIGIHFTASGEGQRGSWWKTAATAADLCRAGSWSTSGAFARYLDLRSLESQAAAAAQGALDFEGDSENDI